MTRKVHSAKISLIAAVLAILVSVAQAADENTRTQPHPASPVPRSVSAVIRCDYPPISYWDNDTGKPTGFFVDIMDKVAERAGLQVHYICENSWSSIIDKIKRGEADLSNMISSEERKRDLLFTTPFETTYITFFVRSQSNIDPERLPDGIAVGILKKSATYDKLNGHTKMRLVPSDNLQESLFALLAGKIDLFAGPQSVILNLVRESGLEGRIRQVGKPLDEAKRGIVVRKDNVALLSLLNSAMNGFVEGPEYRRIYVKWYGKPVPYWTNQKIVTVSGIFLLITVCGMGLWRHLSIIKLNKELRQNIAERRQAEDKVRELLVEKNIILDNADIGITFVKDRKQVWANRKMGLMFGRSLEEMENQSTIIFYPSQEAYQSLGENAYPVLLQGRVYETEIEMQRADGTIFLARLCGKAIEPADLSAGSIWIFEDITERKHAEEQIRQSLLEKETLLKEIHHRVKNNLAIVSSLLALQSARINNETLKAIFEDSQQRIRAMALVHEKLYRTTNFSQIDFGDYTNSIVKELLSTFDMEEKQITTRINIADIKLELAHAIPCGLIINELLTNSFKYAFPGHSKGEITISFIKSDESYTLTIKDTGIGLPEGFDCLHTTTLGLQLVNVLANQIGGTFKISSEGGTESVIKFRARGDSNRKEEEQIGRHHESIE